MKIANIINVLRTRCKIANTGYSQPKLNYPLDDDSHVAHRHSLPSAIRGAATLCHLRRSCLRRYVVHSCMKETAQWPADDAKGVRRDICRSVRDEAVAVDFAHWALMKAV